MKILIILVVALMCGSAFAVEQTETRTQQLEREFADDATNNRSENNVCDFPVTVSGKQSYKTAPCPKGEFMASCNKEIIDEKGWTRWEAIPCPPGQRKTVNQMDREEDASQKRKCGKDYMMLRIGMKIERLEECYGAVYLTETTSKRGVTKTYRTTFDLVQVKDGRVVSYTRRIDN